MESSGSNQPAVQRSSVRPLETDGLRGQDFVLVHLGPVSLPINAKLASTARMQGGPRRRRLARIAVEIIGTFRRYRHVMHSGYRIQPPLVVAIQIDAVEMRFKRALLV